MGEERGRTASTTEPRDPPGEPPRAKRITPAKGSGAIRREDVRAIDDMATREMDPDQFRALLTGEWERTRSRRTPTIPVTSEVMEDLVAQTRDADDDLAIAVEEPPAPIVLHGPDDEEPHAPHEPLALAELDPRRAIRHAATLAPPRLPTAPASGTRLTALLVVLVLAIGGAVAYYALTGRVA